MKKILLTLVAFLLVNILQVKAQERNLTDAWFALKNNELLNAKKSIDEASVHESTKNSAKMFLYRGDVYLRLRGMADSDNSFKEAANQSSIIAAESYYNYLSSTEKKKKSDLEGVYQQMTYAASYCLFDGGKLFENEQYAEAMKYFEAAYNLTKYDVNENLKENGMTSNSILLNLYSTAESMGDRTASRKYLNALIDNKYADANLYIYLARSYYAEGDTATGFKKLLEGREKYPESRFLLMEEMQYYMDKGEIDILLNKFNEVIESDPESDLNYFYRGSLYHQKRNYESARQAG
jgi:Tfp pilus assembly protein PilF